MAETLSDKRAMIAGMTPVLREGSWRFVLVTQGAAPQLLGSAIGTFREDEGVSAIVPADLADELGMAGANMRCITLEVYSDLEGVGLTAAVASALADAGIACNMVAALHHDHAFVPESRAQEALAVLGALQDTARTS